MHLFLILFIFLLTLYNCWCSSRVELKHINIWDDNFDFDDTETLSTFACVQPGPSSYATSHCGNHISQLINIIYERIIIINALCESTTFLVVYWDINIICCSLSFLPCQRKWGAVNAGATWFIDANFQQIVGPYGDRANYKTINGL